MNPLLIPKWTTKKKEAKREVPNFIGVQNEAVRDDAGAEDHITISVSGVTGVPDSSFKLAYQEGAELKTYLSRINLKRAAVYSAVYDRTNYEAGRCRMNYVPKKNAVIQIGVASAGPALHLQRTNHDAQRLALNMGRTGRGPAPKEVVKEKHGRPQNEPQVVRRDRHTRETRAAIREWRGIPFLVRP